MLIWAIIYRNLYVSIRAVAGVIRWNVTNRILSSEFTRNFFSEARQFCGARGEICFATGFRCDSFKKCFCFVLWAFADKTTFFAQIVNKTDHEYLHLGLTQKLKQLFFGVIAVTVLAVSYQNNGAPLTVLGLFGFFVFIDVFDREICCVGYRRLPAFDKKIIQSVGQIGFVCGERLFYLDFVTPDKSDDHRFVTRPVGIYKHFAGLYHLVQLLPERTRIIYHQSIIRWHFGF